MIPDAVARAGTIMRANSRRLAGDRRLPFFLVLLPILIMLVVGTAFGTGGKRLPLGVVVEAEGRFASELVAQLRASRLVAVRDVRSREAARREVRRGRLTAAIVVPADYDQRLLAGGAGELDVVVQPGRAESAQARFAVTEVVAQQSMALSAARFSADVRGGSMEESLARMGPLHHGFLPRAEPAESPFSYTAPSNLVLFVFITALVASAVVVSSRELGVRRRMLATPTPAWAMVLGDMVGAFVIALAQASLMLVVGSVLFGVDWGSPVAVVALLLVISLVAAGMSLVLATLVRTAEQALVIGPPIGILLGMLGGCMWPLESVGPAMRTAGHLVPHAWAMDAFVALIFDDAGVLAVATNLAVLVGFAVALLGLAAVRLRRATIAP